MARTKQPSHPSNKKIKTPTATAPESADDYQALADEEESRGGKWRAGDAAKSARAFERAIAFYDQGLHHHPHSFDLAYNKATLELQLSQQPALLAHWGLSQGDFLAQTLLSHRRALKINDDDVDLLFNTAQVLTSLAEELSAQDQEEQAMSLLHEALEILSSCLAKQEILLEEQSIEPAAEEIDDDDGGVALEDREASSAQRQEESATIIQPISANDLLDTVHASLSALTTLVGLADETALSSLDAMARTLYDKKASSYLALVSAERQHDASMTIALDKAIFVCALANARFTAHDLDFRTLIANLDSFDIARKAERADVLSAEADARREVVLSALEQSDAVPGDEIMECWRQLTIAQDSLGHATKLNDDAAKELKARLYRQKGDIELLRIRIASLPSPAMSDSIRNSRATLLKNARTFYKGALAHAASSEDAETQSIAATRSNATDFLLALENSQQPVLTDDVPQIMEELVDEGLLTASIMDTVSAMLG